MSDETAVEQAVATIRERLTPDMRQKMATAFVCGYDESHAVYFDEAAADWLAEALAPLLVEAAKGVYGTSLAKDLLEAALTRADAAEARAEALQRDLEKAQRTAELRQRMIDIPTAWELTRATDKDQHHERCSYRTHAMLCDCAAARVMERVSGLLAEGKQRADALAAELAAIRAGQDRCEGRYPVPQTSPPHDEPFDVTYRCALAQGHDGPHGQGKESGDAA